jgi:hypothetical protein
MVDIVVALSIMIGLVSSKFQMLIRYIILCTLIIIIITMVNSPYRTFVGAVGGIRSQYAVDAHSVTPYYNSILLCVNSTIWETSPILSTQKNSSSVNQNETAVLISEQYRIRIAATRTLDFSIIYKDFRGFSDAVRVGRYAYLCPLNYADTTFSPYLLRINLGLSNIGDQIDYVNTTGGIRTMVDALNLSMIDTRLKGYSSVFAAGQYLFLVPYRNSYEPQNGQRGHGLAVRLNLNDFTLSGIDYLDLTNTSRNQIPSFTDDQLRGFSYGFACKLIIM